MKISRIHLENLRNPHLLDVNLSRLTAIVGAQKLETYTNQPGRRPPRFAM